MSGMLDIYGQLLFILAQVVQTLACKTMDTNSIVIDFFQLGIYTNLIYQLKYPEHIETKTHFL